MGPPNIPVLVTVHDGWKHRMRIGARADEEEDDEEERLEVEEGSLLAIDISENCARLEEKKGGLVVAAYHDDCWLMFELD